MDTSTYQKTSFIKYQIAKPKRNMCRREVLESLYIYLSCKITTLCCVARCPSGYRLCHAMRALSTNRRRHHAQTNSSCKPRICKVMKYFHALYAKPLKWFDREEKSECYVLRNVDSMSDMVGCVYFEKGNMSSYTWNGEVRESGPVA